MQCIRVVTITFVTLATLSFTTAAHSETAPPQKTLNKKSSAIAKQGLITPPQKTLDKKSDELAKRGVFAPPQKALDKKSDELAKRGAITPPQKTLDKKSDELAKRGVFVPPQKGGGASERGIIIVSGKNKNASDLNPQPLPPKASNPATRAPSTAAMDRLGGGPSATVGVAAKGAQGAKTQAKSETATQQQNNLKTFNQQQIKIR